ncbi:hypothetical protein HA402_010668 [Bradysia odoriphaga]|nr:hypothetical protein HA402_010668 [Bradysia odoriphaga]
MSEEKSVGVIFSEVVEMVRSLNLSQQDQNQLEKKLSVSKNNLEAMCQNLEDLPQQTTAEIDCVVQANLIIEIGQKHVQERLARVLRENREKEEQYAAFMEAKEKEYEAKVAYQKTIQQEIDQYSKILEQKQAKDAEYHQQVKAETGELAKWNKVMQRLRSKLEAKSKLSVEQEDLQSSSVELDKVFSERQAEIAKTRELISTKEKELETVQADNRSKALELTAARSRSENMRATAERETQNHYRIMAEFAATEQKRNIVIDALEQRLAEERAKYEKVKKDYDDLTGRISSEFGNSKSLEEVMVEAQTELQTLSVEHSKLNETIEKVSQSVQLNENKLSQLHKQTGNNLEQTDENMNITETSGKGRWLRRQQLHSGVPVTTERSETEESVFAMPRGIPKKSKRRQKRQQQSQQKVPECQAERVAPSPDSSMGDFGTASSVGEDVGRDNYAKLMTFQHEYFGTNE